MDLVALGKKLEQRRRHMGMPRAEAARRIDVTSNYVWTVERARKRRNGEPSQPSRDVLQRWTAVLGLGLAETNDLLDLAGHPLEAVAPHQSPALPASSAATIGDQITHLIATAGLSDEQAAELSSMLLDIAQTLARTYQQRQQQSEIPVR